MKRSIINIALSVLAIGMGMTSCENNFDAKIYGSLSTTNFPSTAEDFENYMIIGYMPFCSNWAYTFTSNNQRQWYSATGGFLRLFDSTTDESTAWIHGSWGANWTNFSRAQFDDFKYASRGSSDDRPNHYEKVRDISRYTTILNTIETADESVLSSEIKAQYAGEIRLLRGMMMYYMLHLYGPVPVLLDPAKVGDSEEEAKQVRPTLDEFTQYITDDLEYAASHMVETQSEKGRYTADYARFCLMRHYLNEGYHMNGYYQKAYDMFNQFHHTYSLFMDGENPYADQFKIANKFNCEVIMAVSCGDNSSGGARQGNFNPLSWYVVPSDAAKYDDKGNATPFVLQGNGWSQVYNASKEFYETFESVDKRRETILTSYYSKNNYWVTEDNLGDLWDGYIINKFPIETNKTNYQGTDIPLARWADVLLLRAEADVRLHGSVSAEAIENVNQVRRRAGLANLTTDKTSSVDAFMDALLEERGHEMMFEGCRKIDLIRFGKYYTVMNALGRTPSSEYLPIPDYAVDQATESGYELTQYYTRDNYDGPKK